MKKLGLFLVTVLFLSGVNMASVNSLRMQSQNTVSEMQKPQKGEQKSPEEMAKAATQKMVDELGLSKAQEAKVLQINQMFAKKQSEIKSKMKDASETEKVTLKQEMKKATGEKNKQIKEVLTPEQAKKLSEAAASKKKK